ncbi:hypothetical protein [uncultured Roseivirga sp.]|uniref:hypothetical protein n=1 Tax=uncultured Roseivirga sp. TaxID=543088 RepID=UPI000D7AA4E3|nr:hypothetical protein [uncultured Roseivirga sp.]PWL30200.1 MAG: hypothetical protein DCO95_10240 [Roseivirga sp. XM-24bin3]
MRGTILSVILFSFLITTSWSQEIIDVPQLSERTQELVASLKKSKPEVLFTNTEVCDQKVEEVGSIDLDIVVLKTHTAIGPSCKGIGRSIFFIDGEYKGYYQSDEVYPLKIQSDTLIWATEGGREYKMLLTSELPQELNYHGLVLIPVLRN